jgi:hypothetical protein
MWTAQRERLKAQGTGHRASVTLRLAAEVTKNSKSQISNNKQITMTEIVRASLGLPTLQAGPQFQNPKSVLVIGYWNFEFI